MMDHEACGQGAAVREAQDPVEGSMEGDCLVQELVRLQYVRLVVVFRGKGPWEAVVAVVRTVVEACDSWAWI